MNLSTLTECLTYLLAGAFSVYGAAHTIDIGISAFAACALLVCFCGACWSLYKMLTRSFD